MHLSGAIRRQLVEVLDLAQKRGWVGGQALDDYIDHSLGFAGASSAEPAVAVDLGSGGGIPALVLAAVWPLSQWTLVESSLARASFLELHCAKLGWSGRVAIRHGHAQTLASEERYRGRVDLVTARSFGSPNDVVGAAAPLLRPGGELIVSAAPDAAPWPDELLFSHGLDPDRLTAVSPRFHRTNKHVSRETLNEGA